MILYYMMNIEYISIGGTCAIAYQLQINKLRNCAYPFDWVKSQNLKNISKVIKNNFIGYCDFIKSSDSPNKNFPMIDNKNNFDINGKSCIVAKNKYNIRFYHDFDNSNFSNQTKEVATKYMRRIDRFYDTIKQNTKQVIFIREESNINKIKSLKYDINEFIRTIKHINSYLKFKVIILLHNSNNIDIDNYKKSLIDKNIIVYENNNIFKGWKRNNYDWKSLLKDNK